ncbi:hypothetical protein BH20VER1_BH20VER1_11430 [soil metagenome]
MISLLDYETAMPETRLIESVEDAIYLIRGQRVMLDSDLARIYGVSTKRLNEQLRRNQNRFPADFAFRLTAEEFASLRSQIATSSLRGAMMLGSAGAPPAVFGASPKTHPACGSRFHFAMLPECRARRTTQRAGRPRSPEHREIGFHVREKAGRYDTMKKV